VGLRTSDYLDLPKWDAKQQSLVKMMLEKAAKTYYNEEKKSMSDDIYDALRDRYESEVGPLPIGAEPKEGKGTVNVKHSFGHLVGSLSKVNTIVELKEWFYRTTGNDFGPFDVGLSYKYDGNSVVIEYNKGKVVTALTRGRNGKGKDLYHVFKDMTILDESHVGIKYEVMTTYENFDLIQEEPGLSTYANPRSLVAGLLDRDNAHEYVEYLTLVPLGMSFIDEEVDKMDEYLFIEREFSGKVGSLNSIKFNDNLEILEGDLDTITTQIEDIYDTLSTERFDLPFMIDGLVIELLDPKYRKLGITNSKPKWAVALKFPYMEKESTVVDFVFDYGKTSRITPKVVFEPVVFNGAEQTTVSLANYERFEKLGLGIGSKVLVQYRNDTLSYVEKLDVPENDLIEPFEFIQLCPICKKPIFLNDTEVFAYCYNEECDGKIVGRVERYLVKLDIKGVGSSTLKKLYNADMLHRISDLYELDYNEVAKLDGMGKVSANGIKKAIESKQPFDYEILAGLGIDDFGLSQAKDLMTIWTIEELFADYDEDLFFYEGEEFYETLLHTEGFSDIRINKFIKGMRKFQDDFIDVYNHVENNLCIFKEAIAKNGNTPKYKFVITGSVNQWKNRTELKKELELLGHKVSGKVSKNTNYLINNDIESNTGKNKDAKDLGIPIINESFLKSLLLNK